MKRPLLHLLILATLATFAATGGGCGNYSNSDLEFMNAIPQREDMEVRAIHDRLVAPLNAAESARTAIQVTRGLNLIADAFLRIVDGVRMHYPTYAEGNTRFWGPFPAREQPPGWQIEFSMTKHDPAPPDRPTVWFDYSLYFIPPQGVDAPMPPVVEIVVGEFSSTGTVRQGVGHLLVTVEEARTAGLVLTGLEKLRTLEIRHDNTNWPRTVWMDVQNVPPADPTTEAQSLTYDYTRQENGDTDMTLELVIDYFDGALGLETVQSRNRWLGTGEGRSDGTILSGDGANNVRTQCWNRDLISTYLNEPWTQLFTGPEGDPASCIPEAAP